MEGTFNIDNNEIRSLFIKIINEATLNDNTSQIAIEGLLLQVYAGLIRSKNSIKPLPPWLQEVHDYLNDSWNKKVAVIDMAKLVNVHPVTISKGFFNYFKCTFGVYLRKLRLEKSLDMLQKTSIPIEDIALHCAFYDTSHYINTFKRFYAMTPAEYRKLLAK